MPGPSSSQEIELDFVTWHPPDSAPVSILRRVQEGIHREVSEAFATAPHRGMETGGILLGRREAGHIVVEDFEPVPSEHSFGPSYRLSDKDLESLRETLDWFRGGAQPGLAVLGFYRSHMLPDFELNREDQDPIQAEFSETEDVVLLVRPGLMGSSSGDFYLRCTSRPAAAPSPVPAPIFWPPPHPRLGTEPEPRARKRWPWYVAAIAFGLVGGALGYLWLHPQDAAARSAVAPASFPVPAPVAQPVVQGTPIEEAAPPAVSSDLPGIRAMLDHWAAALKRGDVDAAAQCYAPVVSTYFTRHDVPREAVRQSIKQARSRYGHLDIYRISGLGITSVSDSRAVATFRKRWQTSGHGRTVGEEEERMTLVRNNGNWQISSEQTESR